MPDKDQIFIFNKQELALIKSVFADNDALLYTVRKVLLQFPLTDAEKNLIKLSITDPVWKVLKKRIHPDIGPEYPLGQLPHILTTLTDDLRKGAEGIAPEFEAKWLEMDYLTQQFAVLKDLDHPQPIKLADLAVAEYPKLKAYLFLLGYIDPMLLHIKTLAGNKNETPEEQERRLKRDSTK